MSCVELFVQDHTPTHILQAAALTGCPKLTELYISHLRYLYSSTRASLYDYRHHMRDKKGEI
jgi:hypothetical protein